MKQMGYYDNDSFSPFLGAKSAVYTFLEEQINRQKNLTQTFNG
jgi:hypothetical protein